MAIVGRKKKQVKKRSSGKRKRRQEEEEFEGEDHDEFFENADDDGEPGKEEEDEEADLKETPEDARRRLGMVGDSVMDSGLHSVDCFRGKVACVFIGWVLGYSR